MFFEPELRQVLDGTPTAHLFSDNLCRRLRQKGVLLLRRTAYSGKALELTAEALEALETPSP